MRNVARRRRLRSPLSELNSSKDPFYSSGNKTNEEVDDDDDEFLHLENLDSDSLRDEDIGPVLQVKAGAGFRLCDEAEL